jgi:hypothetical protein
MVGRHGKPLVGFFAESRRRVMAEQHVHLDPKWETLPTATRRPRLDRWAEMVSQSFETIRLKKWLERENRQYLKKNPTAKKFKLHNLRGTPMSKAKEAGVHFEDAAIAFGCNADTMRKHYLALDEVAVTDRVMDAIQGNGYEVGFSGLFLWPSLPSLASADIG